MKGVIGDGAYDFRRNFNLLDDEGVEPIIKVRRNAVERLKDAHPGEKAEVRLEAVAESAFSWIKRAFREYVTAKKFENVVREIRIRALPMFIGTTKTA